MCWEDECVAVGCGDVTQQEENVAVRECPALYVHAIRLSFAAPVSPTSISPVAVGTESHSFLWACLYQPELVKWRPTF